MGDTGVDSSYAVGAQSGEGSGYALRRGWADADAGPGPGTGLGMWRTASAHTRVGSVVGSTGEVELDVSYLSLYFPRSNQSAALFVCLFVLIVYLFLTAIRCLVSPFPYRRFC